MDQFWQQFTVSDVFPQVLKPFCVGLILFGVFLLGLLPSTIAERSNPVFCQSLFTLKPQNWEKKDILLAFAFTGIFYVIAIYRLQDPNKFIFDEIYHGRSGMQYLLGQNPMEWTHPPLTKLIISVSLRLWGATFNPMEGVWQEHSVYPAKDVIGWRFASCVFGSLSLFVLYCLARVLSKNRMVAVFSTLFLACDGMFFVQSRVAMTNIFTVFFILLGTLGAFLYSETDKKQWLFVMSAGLSGAVATRWSTLIGVALIGVFLLWHTVLPSVIRVLNAKQDASWLPIIGRVLWLALTLLVIPAGCYLLAYIPYMQQGHDLHKVLEEQKAMWDYHSQLREGHPYSSPWWTWPLMLRPTWYSAGDAPSKEMFKGILCIGNCFIWWAAIPVLAFSSYFAVKAKSPAFRLIALLGLGQWLVWAIQPRTLIFTHYLFEAIPFVCIGLAWFGTLLWNRGGAWRTGVIFYIGVIIAWWIFFYPLLSALPIPLSYYEKHLWMGRLWV